MCKFFWCTTKLNKYHLICFFFLSTCFQPRISPFQCGYFGTESDAQFLLLDQSMFLSVSTCFQPGIFLCQCPYIWTKSEAQFQLLDQNLCQNTWCVTTFEDSFLGRCSNLRVTLCTFCAESRTQRQSCGVSRQKLKPWRRNYKSREMCRENRTSSSAHWKRYESTSCSVTGFNFL